jgi:hypothetical protein
MRRFGVRAKLSTEAKQIHIHSGDLPVARTSFRVEQAHDFFPLRNGKRRLVRVAHVEVAGGVSAFRQNLNRRASDHDEFDTMLRLQRAAQ